MLTLLLIGYLVVGLALYGFLCGCAALAQGGPAWVLVCAIAGALWPLTLAVWVTSLVLGMQRLRSS